MVGDRLQPDEVEAQGYFTAEHVFPWMFEDYGWLKPHREAAEILAEHPWPRLYDADGLRRNEVPVAATIYVNDLYVERDFAEETAALIRGIRTGRPTSTSTTACAPTASASSAGSSTCSTEQPDRQPATFRGGGAGGSEGQPSSRALRPAALSTRKARFPAAVSASAIRSCSMKTELPVVPFDSAVTRSRVPSATSKRIRLPGVDDRSVRS